LAFGYVRKSLAISRSILTFFWHRNRNLVYIYTLTIFLQTVEMAICSNRSRKHKKDDIIIICIPLRNSLELSIVEFKLAKNYESYAITLGILAIVIIPLGESALPNSILWSSKNAFAQISNSSLIWHTKTVREDFQ
jgi:hypothetical protein